MKTSSKLMQGLSKPKIIYANILPRQDLHDGETVIPLGTPSVYASVVNSLQLWVMQNRPNILKEHRLDGGSYGEVIVVQDRGQEGIWVGFTLTAAEQKKFEAGDFRFVSPTIAWNHRANDYNPAQNNIWPAALLEVSLVSVPRYFLGQKPMRAEREGGVYDNSVSYMSQLSESKDYLFIGENKMELTMPELEKLFTDMLGKHIDMLKTEIEKMVADQLANKEAKAQEPEVEVEIEETEMAEEEIAEEATAASEEAAAEEVEAEEEAMSVMKSKLRAYERKSIMAEARVAVLEKELQLTVARSEVQKDLQNRPHLSHMAERMANIFVEDKGLYDDMLNIAVDSRSVFSERTFRGSEGSTSKPLSSDPFTAAAELAERDGIGYSAAWEKVSGK